MIILKKIQPLEIVKCGEKIKIPIHSTSHKLVEKININHNESAELK